MTAPVARSVTFEIRTTDAGRPSSAAKACKMACCTCGASTFAAVTLTEPPAAPPMVKEKLRMMSGTGEELGVCDGVEVMVDVEVEVEVDVDVDVAVEVADDVAVAVEVDDEVDVAVADPEAVAVDDAVDVAVAVLEAVAVKEDVDVNEGDGGVQTMLAPVPAVV